MAPTKAGDSSAEESKAVDGEPCNLLFSGR
jgi:hypothetical protein